MVITPYDKLAEILRQKKIDAEECRMILGMKRTEFFDLMTGEKPFTEEIGAKLEPYINIKPAFWVALQQAYDKRPKKASEE